MSTPAPSSTWPQHLFVPVDVRANADLRDQLVAHAVQLAGRLKARVTLCFVSTPASPPVAPSLQTASYEAFQAIEAQTREEDKRIMDAMITTWAPGARDAGVVVEGIIDERLDGGVAQRIVDAAAFHGADTIVMASHCRHGIAHAVMGSVAEKTVNHATMPVMVVPPMAS